MGKDWQGEREESDANGLRPLDIKVLRCGSYGYGIDTTARELGINPARVKLARKRAREALNVPRRRRFAGAIREARRRGIIE